MSLISASKSTIVPGLFTSHSFLSHRLLFSPSLKLPPRLHPASPSWTRRRRRGGAVLLSSKPSSADLSPADEEWLKKLPEKKKPLYAHSLPGIEAWLKSLGFWQSREDRAAWSVERPDWHAQLSLDVTDLYIRYLKSGPGDLEKDVERRFSYALSREDIENAILGGP